MQEGIRMNIYEDIAKRTQGDIYRGCCPGQNRKINIYKKVYGNIGITKYRK